MTLQRLHSNASHKPALLDIQQVWEQRDMGKQQPSRWSKKQEWKTGTALSLWVESGGEIPQLQIDPLLSEPRSEWTQRWRRMVRSQPACIRLDQEDHRSIRSPHRAVVSPRGSRKLDKADRRWPCLQWKSWWVSSWFSSCRQLLLWQCSQTAKQEKLGRKQSFFRFFLL